MRPSRLRILGWLGFAAAVACSSSPSPATSGSGETVDAGPTAPEDAAAPPPDAEAEAGADPDANSDGGAPCACPVACVDGACPAAGVLPDSLEEAPSDGTSAVACPTAGQPGYGQDCNTRLHVPTFTKTAEVGTDSVTGLSWERTSPGTLSFTEMEAHCAARKQEGYGGYGDWRLPTAREALTLANAGRNAQALDVSVFDSQDNAGIWTSTPYGPDAAQNWLLGGNYPEMIAYPRTIKLPGSHCVRGGPLLASFFVVSPSGVTVKDLSTSLTWQRAPAPTNKTWLEALAYCEGLVLDGHDDWRLPNYKELWSIVDVTKTDSPAIDRDAFPSTPGDFFWSASPAANFRDVAYAPSFENGKGALGRPTSSAYPVRCIRGG